MTKSKTVMVSAAAMVDIDNKVLIAQRQEGQVHGGLLGVSWW